MKFKCLTLLACLFLIAACGEKPKVGGAPNSPEDEDEINLDISAGEDIEVEGNYNIAFIEIDSDTSPEYTTTSTITTVMRNVYVSDDGEGRFVQASIEKAYLNLKEDGTYDLYYKLTNASKQDIEIGKFSGGKSL